MARTRRTGTHERGRRRGGKATRDDASRAPAIERLNRFVLIVTPRQPLVDWVRRLEEREGPGKGKKRFTLEEARTYHRAAYLVPMAEDAHDVEGWIEDNFDLVFEQELFGFEPDRRRWPRTRTVDAFLHWFDLELLDGPIDLVDAPLLNP